MGSLPAIFRHREICYVLYVPAKNISLDRDSTLAQYLGPFWMRNCDTRLSLIVRERLLEQMGTPALFHEKFWREVGYINEPLRAETIICCGSRVNKSMLFLLQLVRHRGRKIVNATKPNSTADQILKKWYKDIVITFEEWKQTHAPQGA